LATKPKIKNLIIKVSLTFFALLIITLGFIIFGANYYLKTFSKQFGSTSKETISQIKNGIKNPFDQDHLNLLLLGLDQKEDNQSMLTDTMMVISINPKNGDYLLFSLPRDLWLPDLQSKINALYYYGQKQNPNKKTQLIEEEIEKLIGQKIDHTIVLKMAVIKDLIDFIGGVEVDIEKGFVDDQFPKDDRNGEVMTIEFESGKQILSGQRALQFIRSRKSLDPEQGTDDARQKRQKQIIMALKNDLLGNRLIVFDPTKFGQLYEFFNSRLETSPKIELSKIVSFYKTAPKIISGKEKTAEVPWKGESAILEISSDPIHNSWILLPKNNDWDLIKEYFKKNLP